MASDDIAKAARETRKKKGSKGLPDVDSKVEELLDGFYVDSSNAWNHSKDLPRTVAPDYLVNGALEVLELYPEYRSFQDLIRDGLAVMVTLRLANQPDHEFHEALEFIRADREQGFAQSMQDRREGFLKSTSKSVDMSFQCKDYDAVWKEMERCKKFIEFWPNTVPERPAVERLVNESVRKLADLEAEGVWHHPEPKMTRLASVTELTFQEKLDEWFTE